VRAYLVPTINALRPLGFQVAIGSSGTVTAIGDMIRLRNEGEATGAGLDTVIDRKSLRQLVKKLTAIADPVERQRSIGGLEEKRADVIVAGAILLDELFAGFEIDRMLTSPYALREGVLLDRSHGVEGGALRLADLRRESLNAMVDVFEEDSRHVQHATDLALSLFDQLVELHGLGPHDRELLEAAGLLHNVGVFVSHSAHHQHSYYIIRNSDRLSGYTEREIEIIAQVARYHRRSAPKSSHLPFMELRESDQDRVRWLAALLRIAIALDRTRAASVADVVVSYDDAVLCIVAQVADGADAEVEVFTANARSELLAQTSARTVEIT
jgi:exopolyphosphatase/guanosine-5'-triphosphate,3'-diphosphate pyrophosphatase